jgi:hypothetical protein
VPHPDPASSFFTHAIISIEPGYQNALLRQNPKKGPARAVVSASGEWQSF